jgi:hypothetical protein
MGRVLNYSKEIRMIQIGAVTPVVESYRRETALTISLRAIHYD